jgi:hypothetical protein
VGAVQSEEGFKQKAILRDEVLARRTASMAVYSEAACIRFAKARK